MTSFQRCVPAGLLLPLVSSVGNETQILLTPKMLLIQDLPEPYLKKKATKPDTVVSTATE